MHGDYATALLWFFISCFGVALVLLGLLGGLDGVLFGHGFWDGAPCGAATAVILAVLAVVAFWLRFL